VHHGDHILVVEDDHDIRHALVELLDDEGYQTRTARNGAEALSHLDRAAPPRMILLDLMMPVMDGWTFRARQLENPEWSQIPVVVMSATCDVQTASDLNADAFLTKPVPAERVLGIVAALAGSGPVCACCGEPAVARSVGCVGFCTQCLETAIAEDDDDPYQDTGGGD
jgi:CheY-like chemotaxis protein